MALREYRPTSPGMRQLIQVDRTQLWKGEPEKVLTEGKKKTGGRNNHGRLTSVTRSVTASLTGSATRKISKAKSFASNTIRTLPHGLRSSNIKTARSVTSSRRNA